MNLLKPKINSNILILNNFSHNDKIELIKLIKADNDSKIILFDPNQQGNKSNLINSYIPKLELLIQKMNERYDLFLNTKVKNIEEYNLEIGYIPYIYLLISELYNLILNKKAKSLLAKLLLNCEQVGIICIIYTKYKKDELHLKYIDDFVKIYNNYNLNDILNNNITSNKDIETISSNMNGIDFEHYAAKILENNGFNNIIITQPTNDYGVDIIASKDDIKYAIQCKKYSSTVGIKAVQEVIASRVMHNCHVAVVLTNSYFTNSAIKLAQKNNVLLWDKDKLTAMLKK